MNLMVVGGGGREHALISALKKNPAIQKIYALPGNGGIAKEAECVPITATDIPALVDFALSHDVNFAVVAPDDPLVLGAVDALEAAGVPAWGPNKAAAIIEGSKSFSKRLMAKYGIPTAAHATFSDEAEAISYLRRQSFPIVVKADGLALGKGVIIAEDFDAAALAVHEMMSEAKFGDSGKTVVIEEFLTGPEVSVLTFTDGKTLVPMVSSMDHKRALDDDKGLNTGGMGVIAPNPYYTDEMAERTRQEILEPTIAAMSAEGRPFKGCLYFGLMLTEDGPKVIEYNCRFGDPEAQAVLPLLESDLLEIMQAIREERLSEVSVQFSNDSSCCVVLASGGYPKEYEQGKKISIGDVGSADVFHAGTALIDGELLTSGGRVISVTARGNDLSEAITNAYQAADQISFEGLHKRSDIGALALKAKSQETESQKTRMPKPEIADNGKQKAENVK